MLDSRRIVAITWEAGSKADRVAYTQIGRYSGCNQPSGSSVRGVTAPTMTHRVSMVQGVTADSRVLQLLPPPPPLNKALVLQHQLPPHGQIHSCITTETSLTADQLLLLLYTKQHPRHSHCTQCSSLQDACMREAMPVDVKTSQLYHII